ncbi:anti-sigma factor [Pseudonocardia sp. KRD291]|uniref:anti-sigma factor family protein n=1 Tax=Pseudonocardia sp. KRD291 TaxID=2792007 RepID=UPI001C49E869|nr:zf-HC2 domain-containing protein [Pseudonocardia sp. KRD291]MBW0105259.1 zf-HC2 domain-containing protein [Pseudonocardia sp. KRD291]
MKTPIPDERHRELRERLGAYVLDQLDDDERAEVDAHLRECPECRAEADDLLPLVRPLAAVDPDALAAGPAAGDPAAGDPAADDPAADDPAAGDPGPDGADPGLAAILGRIRAERDGGDTDSREQTAHPGAGAGAGQPRTPLDPPTIETTPVPHPHTTPDGNGVLRPLRRRPRAANPRATPRAATSRAATPRAATLRMAAAAAVIALAGVGLGTALAPGSSDGPLESVDVQALRPGIDAEAGVVPHTWGVELKLTASGFDQGRTYRAAVLDTAGRTVGAGEFVGTGGAEMECNLNSSVLRDRATGFVVTDEAGSPVLVSRFEA